MFKKIDRLQPGNIEIATYLADLYAQQDLVIEARAHYLIVANAHAQAGATQDGLEVLRKIAIWIRRTPRFGSNLPKAIYTRACPRKQRPRLLRPGKIF
jgi:hypothetical protein